MNNKYLEKITGFKDAVKKYVGDVSGNNLKTARKTYARADLNFRKTLKNPP